MRILLLILLECLFASLNCQTPQSLESLLLDLGQTIQELLDLIQTLTQIEQTLSALIEPPATTTPTLSCKIIFPYHIV